MNTEQKKKEIVTQLLSRNIVVKPDFLERLNDQTELEQAYNTIVLKQNSFEKRGQVLIVNNYLPQSKKHTVQDFVKYFNQRYKALEKMLAGRQELQNLTSIARLQHKQDRETVAVIGLVVDKHITKNKNVSMMLEDPSGQIRVIVTQKNKELYDVAKDTTLDEVIGLTGSTGDNIIFGNNIIYPDIPLTSELKKAPDEAYAAVLACVHVGSKKFLEDRFLKFVDWLNGSAGTPEQQAMAQKVKYLFVCGDVVDGVGIYPGQEEELALTDIKQQYDKAAELFSKIRKDVHIIMGAGNHDALRISEPQPPLPKKHAEALYTLPNIIHVTNPCVVNIHASQDFSGFTVLTYHGFSFDDYGEIVPSIRDSGAHISDRVGLIMRYLLQRRHLAPTHSSTLYIPDPTRDPLVISEQPDLFVAGHIHKSAALNYRSTSIIAGSCWQSKTDFQEKVGHEPDPGTVPVINLQTRQVTMMRF